MKKVIVCFLVIFLISCSSTNTGTGVINTDTGTSTGTDIGTGVINTDTGTGIVETIISYDEMNKMLKNNADGDFLEEIPWIDSYYTNNAFFEFYIFSAIKNNDINECNKIKNDNEKQLCSDLFSNKNSINKIIDIYVKYGEDKEYAKNIFNVFENINNNNLYCDNENYILYFACRKILDKDFNVYKNFINYNRIRYSNQSIIEQNYLDLIKKEGLDIYFTSIVEKNILKIKN